MRLVSLWWEFGLPGLIPILGYLDSKSNSFLYKNLKKFLPRLPRVSYNHVSIGHTSYCFFTSTPAQSSKTRITEQKSSSALPEDIFACSICWVKAVTGSGTPSSLPASNARETSLCIHLVAKFVPKSLDR